MRPGLALLLALLIGGPLAAQEASEPAALRLNVVIPVFDPGLSADPSEFRDLAIFPRIRRIEAKLLPFHLAEALTARDEWGAVRVVAEPDPAAELQLIGRIVTSDGERLEIELRAEDATGRRWFERRFAASASAGDDAGDGLPASEFRSLYDEVATAMAAARDALAPSDLRRIPDVSLMRYGLALAPDVFGQYVERRADGIWALLRLPAYGDPMLRRMQLIRGTEHLITDTVDAHFRETGAALSRAYRVWRDYRRKYRDYEAENERFAERNTDDAPRGSWEAIKDQYDIYKYDRITVQERDRLAVAFSNEVAPTLERMEESIAELVDWIDDGYREWRRILDELQEVDSEVQQVGN